MKQNNSDINDQINENISVPMNNKEYKKMIANAKSKYMQDYKDSTNKKSKFMEEKYFNNLLSTYYDDYTKLKTKFNLKDKDDTEKTNLDVDEKDYELKKENINQIFSGDLLDIQDFNFDFCDNLINDLPKENNYTLLKSTQNKKDYELRLQGFNNNKNQNQKINKSLTLNEEQNEDEEDKVNLKGKNDNEKINNDNKNNDNNKNVINSENNIEKNDKDEKESFEYMEDNEQFNENNDNYLILNQQNIDEDLPLFSDIISSKYNKNYRVPFYEHDEEEKNIEIKKVEKIEYDDENKLILVNENKKYMKFEDIIKSDFNEDYKIPEYKIPNDIKKEIEEEQKNKQEQKINNEENKKNDVINNEVNNVINIKESGAFIEDNGTKVEEKKEIENKKEENDSNKIKKEEEHNNNNDNYEDEKFEKIDVDKLNEIDEDSGNNNIGNNNDQNNYNNNEENKKYDDFEG
jgi:hypothetical protein